MNLVLYFYVSIQVRKLNTEVKANIFCICTKLHLFVWKCTSRHLIFSTHLLQVGDRQRLSELISAAIYIISFKSFFMEIVCQVFDWWTVEWNFFILLKHFYGKLFAFWVQNGAYYWNWLRTDKKKCLGKLGQNRPFCRSR